MQKHKYFQVKINAADTRNTSVVLICVVPKECNEFLGLLIKRGTAMRHPLGSYHMIKYWSRLSLLVFF